MPLAWVVVALALDSDMIAPSSIVNLEHGVAAGIAAAAALGAEN